MAKVVSAMKLFSQNGDFRTYIGIPRNEGELVKLGDLIDLGTDPALIGQAVIDILNTPEI